MSQNKKPDIKSLFPKRPAAAHKGDFGRVVILAGSAGMLGAGILSSRAALRTGAGLVYLAVPKELQDITNVATPEVIVQGYRQINDLFPLINECSALAIGPGLGSERRIAKELLLYLNETSFSAPIVVDADGLTAFNDDRQLLSKLNLKMVLTPHPGELSRLIGLKVAEIQAAREKVAISTAKLLKKTIVLKGRGTVIASPVGEYYINNTGNPGMATAGSGDVLTGMMVAMLAQRADLFQAAAAAVYLHGLAGDLAAKETGEYSLVASDIIKLIPEALKKGI